METTPPPATAGGDGGFCARMRIVLALMVALAIEDLMRSNINMVSPFLDNFKRFKQCGLKRPKKPIENL
jgi:hypothetical protein